MGQYDDDNNKTIRRRRRRERKRWMEPALDTLPSYPEFALLIRFHADANESLQIDWNDRLVNTNPNPRLNRLSQFHGLLNSTVITNQYTCKCEPFKCLLALLGYRDVSFQLTKGSQTRDDMMGAELSIHSVFISLRQSFGGDLSSKSCIEAAERFANLPLDATSNSHTLNTHTLLNGFDL